MGLNKTLATGKFKNDRTSLWGDQGYLVSFHTKEGNDLGPKFPLSRRFCQILPSSPFPDTFLGVP